MKLTRFIQLLISEKESNDQFRLCAAFQTLDNALRQFNNNESPQLTELFTKDYLRRYRNHLDTRITNDNSTAFHFNTLRSIYAAAVRKDKVVYNHQLFHKLIPSSAPTVKRSLLPEYIAKIFVADLSAYPILEFCRNIFILCFFLQGMPLADIAQLKRNNLVNNVITYRRKKTKTIITITLSPHVMALLSRYRNTDPESPYLLNLITKEGKDGYNQYQTFLRGFNRNLKTLGSHLGIPVTLTSYVARHTWATLAYHNGVAISIISQSLGHKTEETTHYYLASFASEHFVEANKIVYQAMLKPLQEGKVETVTLLPPTRKNHKKKVKQVAYSQPEKQEKQEEQAFLQVAEFMHVFEESINNIERIKGYGAQDV